jgi:hypothetical protein
MSGYKSSLTLGAANALFEFCGVTFIEDEVEGGYLARHPNGAYIRRPRLMVCAITVLKEWFKFIP